MILVLIWGPMMQSHHLQPRLGLTKGLKQGHWSYAWISVMICTMYCLLFWMGKCCHLHARGMAVVYNIHRSIAVGQKHVDVLDYHVSHWYWWRCHRESGALGCTLHLLLHTGSCPFQKKCTGDYQTGNISKKRCIFKQNTSAIRKHYVTLNWSCLYFGC